MEHPSACYVYIYTTTEIGIVRWGESGYYRTDYGHGFTKKDADKFNSRLGLTEEEAEAMIMCSMANPKDWDKHYQMCLKSCSENGV